MKSKCQQILKTEDMRKIMVSLSNLMANFMCWLDWSWSAQIKDFFLDVSVKMLLNEINIWTGGLSRLPSLLWVDMIRSIDKRNRTEAEKNELIFCLSALRDSSFLALRLVFTWLVLLVQDFRLRLNYTTGFPGSPDFKSI